MKVAAAYLRVALALAAVVVITAYAMSLIRSVAVTTFKSSRGGQVVEQFKHVAPQIERRDREVDELTRP